MPSEITINEALRKRQEELRKRLKGNIEECRKVVKAGRDLKGMRPALNDECSPIPSSKNAPDGSTSNG